METPVSYSSPLARLNPPSVSPTPQQMRTSRPKTSLGVMSPHRLLSASLRKEFNPSPLTQPAPRKTSHPADKDFMPMRNARGNSSHTMAEVPLRTSKTTPAYPTTPNRMNRNTVLNSRQGILPSTPTPRVRSPYLPYMRSAPAKPERYPSKKATTQ